MIGLKLFPFSYVCGGVCVFAVKFSLGPTLAVEQILICCISLSCSLMYFLTFLETSSLVDSLVIWNCVVWFPNVWKLSYYLSVIDLLFDSMQLENTISIIYIILNVLILVYVPEDGLSWPTFGGHVLRRCSLLLLNGMFYICSLGPCWLYYRIMRYCV